jgi:hypothetical protein
MKNYYASKKNHVSTFKFFAISIIITSCSITSIGIPQTVQSNNNPVSFHHLFLNNETPSDNKAIQWDVRINFSETAGGNDYIYFGEAPDANDGPPADTYDVAKPPAPPMPPYIRAYLNDNLPVPYNNLWKDYRQYPDTQKTWNLSVQWAPEDGESPTTITMIWSPAQVGKSEYTTVNLCTNTGTMLKNMLVDNSYIFTCPAYVVQNFKIICLINQPPNPPKITGPTRVKVGVATDYSFKAISPSSEEIYYFIDWGDYTNSSWIGPYLTGEEITQSHTWIIKGTYKIKAKVKNIYGSESDWAILSVTLPCSSNKSLIPLWLRLFEQFRNVVKCMSYTRWNEELVYFFV